VANNVRITSGTPELAVDRYTLVVANILATPLKVLAPLLCNHVAPGGRLLLAGILERQCEELTQAYAPYCDLEVLDGREGWILMSATR
jgi:ribosomal protein L11 methyltransferase